jgi:hypothetical protein
MVSWSAATPAVQHVALREREERVHGGVVAGGADLAHRSGHAVAGQCPVQFPGTKLRSPVGVKDAASGLTAAGDRGLDSGDERIRSEIE